MRAGQKEGLESRCCCWTLPWPPKAHMIMACCYCGVELSSQRACLRWALQDFHPSPSSVHLPGCEASGFVLNTLLTLLLRHPHQRPQNNDSAWLWAGSSKAVSQAIFSLCQSFRISGKDEKLGDTERKRPYTREGLWVNCAGLKKDKWGGQVTP